MFQLIFVGLAAVVGLIVGAMIGAWIMDRRFRERIAEIGAEVARLRAVAVEKLTGDDPDLPALLKNLQAAADNAHRAVNALELQAEVTRRKSAGGREVIASSRHILRLMEELGAEIPDPSAVVAIPAVKAARPIEAKKASA
ncbi:MAG: hypothetical protein WD076_01550 [Parvularculaceae bacterium]